MLVLFYIVAKSKYVLSNAAPPIEITSVNRVLEFLNASLPNVWLGPEGCEMKLPLKTVRGMDAELKPPWMGSRRVLRGNFSSQSD